MKWVYMRSDQTWAAVELYGEYQNKRTIALISEAAALGSVWLMLRSIEQIISLSPHIYIPRNQAYSYKAQIYF